jgi:hypothetical protein
MPPLDAYKAAVKIVGSRSFADRGVHCGRKSSWLRDIDLNRGNRRKAALATAI